MSTQQDIYAAGSKNRPPMLNKENYVPWSLRLLCYAKSRLNGKLIYNFIMNDPYVKRMIPEPGDADREVPVNPTFHEQTDDELTKKELKQIETDDQAIHTILLGLPKDIYAVVDSSDLDEIEEVNANCILMANLQPASTLGTQTDDAPVYDSDGLAKIIMVNIIPPDHVDGVPVVEPNQHDDVPVVPEPVLVDEDEDPKEEEFEVEEEPQEEEDDMESEPEDVIGVEDTIESEDETVPASVHEVGESSTATFLREDNDGLMLGLMRRDINSLFGRMASLSRRLCDRETAHALVEKKEKQRTSIMELEEARFSNTFLHMQNERVERDLYWTRVRAHEFYQEMICSGFVFKERLNEAIDIPVKDEKSLSSEPRGSPSDSIMPPKSAPLTQAVVRRMIKESVDAAIAAEQARHANAGNDARGSGPGGKDVVPVVRECTFAGFMKCNPTIFHGIEEAVELRRWFEKTKIVFGISEFAEDKKETVNQMSWIEMKQLMTAEFYPVDEIQLMEYGLWNMKFKEYNIVAYTQRFNELALMCPRMVEPERVKVNAYIRGLTENIKGEVTSSKPTNLNEAVRMARDDLIACLNKALAFLIAVASLRGDKDKVILVLGIRVMLLDLGETMQVDRQGLLNATTIKEKAMLAKAQEARQILDEEKLAFLVNPGVPGGQAIQTIILNNATFQTEDLDTLSEDFGKRFTPQQEMDVEQAFWLCISNPTSKPSDASPVTIEAPKELPKVSLVNESLKKLKFHLAKFDNVVKIRTTPDAHTECECGFEHTKAVFNNEIIPFVKSLKDIFNVFDRDLLNEIMKVFKEQFDSIKRICVHTKEQSDSLIDELNLKSTENEDLKAQIQDKVDVTPKNKAKKVRFAKPLTSSSNIKHVESSTTSDSNTPMLSPTGLKSSTSNCGSNPSGNKKNDRLSQTPSRNMKNTVEAQPRNVNKKNCVVEPIHNVDVKQLQLNANFELICATCKKSMFDDVHDMCLLDLVKNVNIRRTFTIVSNSCPLTRITSANVVPPKKTTSHSVESQKPELKVYRRKLKDVKNIGSSKKAKIVDSKNANHSEPNHTWGTNATDIPSSVSLVMTGCPDCSLVSGLRKSKKSSHQPKAEDTNQEKLYILHMDLCGPMRVRYGAEFVNQTLREFYENVGISYQTFVARTPQQNSVVKRQNQTLLEAARTMLIFSKASLFLWAEAINTACYTQNRLIIRRRYNKTPYELMQDKKPDVSFFHVFGVLCYPTNDNDDLGKLDAKADIVLVVDAPRVADLAISPMSTLIDQDASSSIEPKNFKQAMTEPSWIDAMQEEIYEFERLETLMEIKAAKPKAKRVTIQELSEFRTTSPSQPSQPPQAKDKGKGIMVEHKKPLKKKDQTALDEEVARKLKAKMKAEMKEEETIAREKNEANIALSIEERSKLLAELIEYKRKYFAAKRAEEIRNKPPIKAQEKSLMCTYMKNIEGYKQKDFKGRSFDAIKKMFDNVYKRVNTFMDMNTEIVEERLKKNKAEVTEGSFKRAGDEIEQESAKRQRLEKEDDITELKRCLEIVSEDDDDVTNEATPLSSKSPTIVDYKIYREGKKSYFKIIKTRFEKTKPVDDMDNLLFQTLRTMFEHHVEDNIWKYQQGSVKVLHWKLFDSCGVHCITTKNMVYYLLVEKMYLFTNNVLHQIWNDVRLQVDYEVDMAYALLRLIRKRINEGYIHA
nr:retrovirus-related Pol polyprotein from transposon TNT 1-94 [Tanacetum cinerariifolium]